jgi:polyribonucleotide nucleotidyltransferase
MMSIDPEKIGLVIGPGGKTIRSLQTEYGVNVDVDDDGSMIISSTSRDAVKAVRRIIEQMTAEPEVGEVYDAKVVTVTDFGAFCEIFPGREGLLHISEIEWRRIDKVEDVLKVGDPVKVKLVNITPEGKLDLSRKVLLPKPEGYEEKPRGGNRGGKPGGGKPGGGGPRRGGGGPPRRGGRN